MSLYRHVPVTWDVDVFGKEDRLPVVKSSSPAYFDVMDSGMNKMYNDMRQASALGPDAWRLRESPRENPVVVDGKGNRKYHLEFDVRHFRPEEITIQTVGNELSVTAKHEEIGPGREVSRNYNRRYKLPTELNVNELTSRLSPEGLLTIEAPLPAPPPPSPRRHEVVIPIQHSPK